MLTPENLQLHSEAAALLLIWAANSIKHFACHKFFKGDGDNPNVLKMDNLPEII
jgi:hypothetical protein